MGEDKVAERYGNLFEMYERITDDNPQDTNANFSCRPHTMGGFGLTIILSQAFQVCCDWRSKLL